MVIKLLEVSTIGKWAGMRWRLHPRGGREDMGTEAWGRRWQGGTSSRNIQERSVSWSCPTSAQPEEREAWLLSGDINSRRSIKWRRYSRAKSWDLTGCSEKKELTQSDKKQLGCHVGGHSHLLLGFCSESLGDTRPYFNSPTEGAAMKLWCSLLLPLRLITIQIPGIGMKLSEWWAPSSHPAWPSVTGRWQTLQEAWSQVKNIPVFLSALQHIHVKKPVFSSPACHPAILSSSRVKGCGFFMLDRIHMLSLSWKFISVLKMGRLPSHSTAT